MRRILLGLASIGVALSLTAPAAADESASPQPSTPAASARTSAPASAPAERRLTSSTVGGDQLNLAGRQLNATAATTRLPKIWAKTWIIADATTGEVLAAKGAHVRRAPASTLKTLTAVTLLPRLPLDGTTVAKAKATRADGTRVGIIAGKTYRIDDLMYAMLLASGNDAAIVLAQANGGVKQTIEQMNQTAQRLQALDTVAKTPNGLDKAGQLSSAYDLALIARAGLANPQFAEIVATATYDFPGKGRKRHPIYNQNRLLRDGYRGADGVKMGFTSDAGRTFVASATRKGHTLVFVGMGIVSTSENAARTALTWGFANLGKVRPVGTLVDPVGEEASAAATAPTPESASTTPPVDLSTAGLDVPPPDDPMAPWWFWAIIVLAILGTLAGWRLSRGVRRSGASFEQQAQAIRVDYHPYDPR